MNVLTTPLYAAIFGLIFTVLSIRTVLLRRKLKVAIGYSEQPILIRAISVHANFAEYVPFALLLIFFLETQTQATVMIHILCVALLLGRLIHAYGVSQIKENYMLRTIGMILTLGVVISTSQRLILYFIDATAS